MPRNFELAAIWPPNNPRSIIRLGLGLLIAANLVAGYFLVRPIGGSPADLRQQEQELRTQIHQQQGILDTLGQTCQGELPVAFRYATPAGANEVVTSLTPLKTSAGCWAIVTSFSAGMVPGSRLAANFAEALSAGTAKTSGEPVTAMLMNSLVMALAIAAGKILISLPSAYAVVFFRFPLRRVCFWAIFVTLMPPVLVVVLMQRWFVRGLIEAEK